MRAAVLIAGIALPGCIARSLTAQAAPAELPIRAGVTIVPAVVGDAERQDYEQVVAIASATDREITLQAFAEYGERDGRRRQVTVSRRMSRADVAGAPVHVLGYRTADAVSLPGTTSLGPSLEVVRSLRATGRATYSVKNSADRQASTGTISLVEKSPVSFPVLLNGRRGAPATAAGQAAKPDACALVDAAEMLRLTGRTDLFGKGPQVQDPSEIPQRTSGCHFLEVLFLLDTPFAPERFARARRSTETGGLLKVQSISGVGDEAYYEWDPRPGNFRLVGIMFRSGSTRVSISDNIPADSIETMKKWLLPMAKTAAARLK